MDFNKNFIILNVLFLAPRQLSLTVLYQSSKKGNKMKLFKLCIYLLVFTLSSSFYQATALAASENHRKAANDLLDTMDLNTLLSGSIESMLQLQLSQNPSLLPFEKTMQTFFNKYMSGESLREGFLEIYIETFTEKELKEMNAFYNTATGKKALKETPALMSKGAALGQKRVQENISELQSMIAEEAKKIQEMQQKTE